MGCLGCSPLGEKIFVKQDFWIDITGLFQKQDLSQEIAYIYIATGYHGDDIIGNTKSWTRMNKTFKRFYQMDPIIHLKLL